VRNVARLAELSGVHENTIRRHLSEWEKEAQEIVASSSEWGLAIQLSEKNLEQHTKDSAFMRNQLDKLKFEIETLEKMAVRLGEWLDKFDGGELVEALQIFGAWQQATGTESSLRGQFIAMKKLWDQKVGIDALQDIGVVKQKEIAKGQAKIAVKQMETETAGVVRNVTSSGVFARPSDAGKVKALDAGA
jgi:hypothetical protein